MPGLFHMPRIPEPEVMDAASEVEAYASATGQKYLEKIDLTFVDHVARLLALTSALTAKTAAGESMSGVALDIGCGPGQIPIMMARRWPGLRMTGIDAAPHMIEQARAAARDAGVAIAFQVFRAASDSDPHPAGQAAAGRLPFNDHSFDLVTCNSVLHHLPDPVAVFNEMARVAKPGGAVLVRDLRRPTSLTFPLHVRWFGRHYSGEMRRLYEASVRAAYTVDELKALLKSSRLDDGRAHVFRHGRTHIGIERIRLA